MNCLDSSVQEVIIVVQESCSYMSLQITWASMLQARQRAHLTQILLNFDTVVFADLGTELCETRLHVEDYSLFCLLSDVRQFMTCRPG